MNKKNIIFAGTPEFALPCLKAINEIANVSAVFTQPDRKSGRGQKITKSPIKIWAEQHDIKIFQPNKMLEYKQHIIDLNPDIIIVVAYGNILPKSILELPKYGCINVHASLLPRWRGAAPIQRAILAGDNKTGICIMQMDQGLDTGDILLQQELIINSNDNSQIIHDKLANIGADLIIKLIENIEDYQNKAKKQPEEGITYADKIQKPEALINWNQSAQQIKQQIHAFNPSPMAYTFLNNNRIRIITADLIYNNIDKSTPTGTILSVDEDIIVATKNHNIAIKKLQWPNEKPSLAIDLIKRKNLQAGMKFAKEL